MRPFTIGLMKKKYSLKLEIGALPKTRNQTMRMHWAVRHKYIKEWDNLVKLHIGSRLPDKPLTKAKLVFTRFSSKESDFDNLVGSFKFVTDALTKLGVILDDKPSIIGSPTFNWVKTRPKQGKIIVEIIEI